jgi:hypothetical protein
MMWASDRGGLQESIVETLVISLNARAAMPAIRQSTDFDPVQELFFIQCGLAPDCVNRFAICAAATG